MDDDTRLRVQGINLTPPLRAYLEMYRSEGLEPAWSRVWSNGRDVTEQRELWPWPWNPSKRPGGY